MRSQCPRSSHAAAVAPARSKRRDPLGLIEQSNAGRIEHLLPVRFTRMLESPFAFFRGTAVIQAHDLRGTPSAGIEVQACGDCHLMNFGGFASPERSLLFDINDFDETFPGPFEWDLKRLAASFVLAARWRGFGKGAARGAVTAAVRTYREQIAVLADMDVLDAWYARVAFDDLLKLTERDPGLWGRVEQAVRSANKRTSEAVFHKMTREVRGRPRIVDQPPLVYHADPTLAALERDVVPFITAYRQTLPPERRILLDRYELVDVAMKVVGVGSVGTLCYVALFMADADDPLFLQVKEARPSVLEGLAGPMRHENNGARVVIGQRIMQSASDIFLGWSHGPRGRHFYVRQLRDHKVAPDLAAANEHTLTGYARLCGRTLARAHARSGKASEIAGYLGSTGKFDQAMTEYAAAYGDQVEKDYEAFRVAVRDGRFPTETSPSDVETAVR